MGQRPSTRPPIQPTSRSAAWLPSQESGAAPALIEKEKPQTKRKKEKTDKAALDRRKERTHKKGPCTLNRDCRDENVKKKETGIKRHNGQ